MIIKRCWNLKLMGLEKHFKKLDEMDGRLIFVNDLNLREAGGYLRYIKTTKKRNEIGIHMAVTAGNQITRFSYIFITSQSLSAVILRFHFRLKT